MTLLILATCGLQIALIYRHAPWTSAALAGLAVAAILAMLAWIRSRWNPHLDMFLLMLGPGGLAMLLAEPPSCNASWTGFATMSLGMLAAAAPLCWWLARCVQQARREGRGLAALAIDLAGMQAGMLLGHLPLTLLPMSPRMVWMHHALMLAGMTLGMLGVAAAIRNDAHPFWRQTSG